MRIKLAGFVTVVTVLVIGGVFFLPSASGQTTLTVVYPYSEGNEQTLEWKKDHVLRPAERIQARGPLLDATQTTQMGNAFLDCVVQRRVSSDIHGLWSCNYTLRLEDGTIIVQGLDPRGPGVYEMAVLGGTGAYAGASGDAEFTDVGDDGGGYTAMTINLMTP